MEKTTLQQLIDFNDKLIAEKGNEMTAYEIHQKVIRKAAELLEQEKEIIETPADAKPVLAAVFSPWDYAEDAFSETLNFMTDEELSEIDNFDNEDELREYLQQFFERT